MDIPLSGSTATGRNAAGHNSGHDRGLSFSNGSEARSRGPATANQQRPALARSRNLPRSNRPIHKRRDRARRACPYNQGNRAQPYQQTHFTQVGKMSAQGRKTLSRSGLAPQVAGRTENQGPPARAHVPIVREGHALGACSFRAKPDRSGRTQRSQQTAQSAADSDGARVRGPAQSTTSTLPIDGSSRRLYRIANQRGSGLRWQSIDFERLAMVVTEGWARSQTTKLKSEWKRLCPETSGNWVFPSPRTNRPYDSSSLRKKVLKPAAQRAKIQSAIGWHSLRHSYRAWLDDTGVPLGVQQKLMRHANISTTMNVYGGAFMDAKRRANTSVVQRVLSQKQPK